MVRLVKKFYRIKLKAFYVLWCFGYKLTGHSRQNSNWKEFTWNSYPTLKYPISASAPTFLLKIEKHRYELFCWVYMFLFSRHEKLHNHYNDINRITNQQADLLGRSMTLARIGLFVIWHTTDASFECPQVCNPEPLFEQSRRDVSQPLHPTPRRTIWPLPSPYLAPPIALPPLNISHKL